ncbi:MAG: MIP family channel protein [Planctomycetota bacterium]|nr:MIP family channel protein [Planctomycetota bacterium]
MNLIKKLGAEFLGTFALVFAGCGAAAMDTAGHGLGGIGIALVFGLVVMAMIHAVGHISGAHFNPAVTLAFAASRHFPKKEVLPYWAAQCLGALLASALLAFLMGEFLQAGVTHAAIGVEKSFLLEVILSFFLMFIISAVATDTRAVGEMAGVSIGGWVLLAALFAGPLTGASMNPARSLGPALLRADTADLWIYLSAPFLGALFGAWAYRLIRCDDTPPASADGCC